MADTIVVVAAAAAVAAVAVAALVDIVADAALSLLDEIVGKKISHRNVTA